MDGYDDKGFFPAGRVALVVWDLGDTLGWLDLFFFFFLDFVFDYVYIA